MQSQAGVTEVSLHTRYPHKSVQEEASLVGVVRGRVPQSIQMACYPSPSVCHGGRLPDACSLQTRPPDGQRQ